MEALHCGMMMHTISIITVHVFLIRPRLLLLCVPTIHQWHCECRSHNLGAQRARYWSCSVLLVLRLSRLLRLSSHTTISLNTSSTLSSGSPEVKACHISGYSLIVLSRLLARSYNALLTSGSVTVSASPCTTKNGKVTCNHHHPRYKLCSAWSMIRGEARNLNYDGPNSRYTNKLIIVE